MRLKCVALSFTLLIILAIPAFAQKPTYIGADKCKLCHKVEHASWLTTKHAKAFDALKPADQAKAECVGCHITGGNKELKGVQCEACHGPGSEYKAISVMKDQKKSIAAGLIIPDEKLCATCHNKKSPQYKPLNFAEAVKKVHDKKPKS